jgi:hypothetical protein
MNRWLAPVALLATPIDLGGPVRITILISALLCSACAGEPKAPSADPWLRELRDTGIGPFDVDGDGSSSSEDCDDTDPLIYPGADEVCDGRDNDCDGEADEGLLSIFFVDSDGDGFGTDSSEAAACEMPSGTVTAGGDCDDADAEVHPDADEICNGLDSDCDGQVDSPEPADTQRFYADSDGDGFGDSLAVVLACDQPAGTSVNDLDCDDSSFAIFPGASEYCDGIDNNCDGVIDDLSAIDAGTWNRDADGDGFGNPDITDVGCTAPTGFVEDGSDCDDTDLHVHPAADEVCNGADDDCDGTIDEGFSLMPWYRDADGDGHGDFTRLVYSCTPLSGYSASSDDCDDAEYWSHPGLAELCDEIDNDCDGDVDEDPVDALTWYLDSDSDGFGDAAEPTLACAEPSGYTADATDCDDSDGDIFPDAEEVCDGQDNDCDGLIDPDSLDSDGDGIANCVDESVYLQDFSTGTWDGWGSWYIGGNTPAWDLSGGTLMEMSNAANAIAYSPNLGYLDSFTLSVDIMQDGGGNHGCGIAYSVVESDQVILIEWRDPTAYYGWYWYSSAIIIYELRDGGWVWLDSVEGALDISRDYGAWATLSVDITGSLIGVYLDDELVLAHAYAGELSGPGRVGLWTWDNDGGVYFDNVTVTQP